MIWKIVFVLVFASGVCGDEEAVSQQRVTIHHSKYAAVVSQADKKQENHKDYAESYPSYEFSYSVHDPHTHDIKGQTEERDGGKVKGDYWLIEPTGRKRIIKYHADDEIGFNAQVDYTKNEYKNDAQNNGNVYEVMEGNKEDEINIEINNKNNENNNEKGEIENSENQGGNIQEEILGDQETNGGIEQNNENDGAEQNENNNNENKEPISDAIVTLEKVNENIESQDRCKCDEINQNKYSANINEVKNNNIGIQEMSSRKKRKNVNRSINLKREDNIKNLKNTELSEAVKNNIRKSSHSDRKKNSHNDHLNDRKKKNGSVDFGIRNSKRKPTRDSDIDENKAQNKTIKIETTKESEDIDLNDSNDKYQHRIFIHHPKAIAPKPNKKS